MLLEYEPRPRTSDCYIPSLRAWSSYCGGLGCLAASSHHNLWTGLASESVTKIRLPRVPAMTMGEW